VTTYTFNPLTAADGSSMVMDPHLMRAIAYRNSGRRKSATTSTTDAEIAVLARVDDLKAWENLSEVFAGVAVSQTDGAGDNTGWIVSGRLPISQIEKVRRQPWVKSLKAARRLHPGLAAGTAEILAGQQLPAGMRSQGGSGAIVGIVDFGCDFAHRNFQDANRRTRLRFIWDQTSQTTTPGVRFGRLISAAEINAALATAQPYKTLGYVPSPPNDPAHGTHVMDIAAGNGRGTGVPGVAPQAEILFVQLSSTDVPWEGPDVVGKNFGDSVQLLEAIAFVFEQAGTKPCAINVSLGTNGGPHDGSTLVEQAIDSLVRQKPNRAVIIAASNSFADGIHAQGKVPANGQTDLSWRIGPQDFTDNEFELWYGGNGQLEVELIDPNGTSVARVPVNNSGTVHGSDNDIAVFIANRLDDPNNHDNTIGIFLSPAAVAGVWTVRLHNSTPVATSFHAWIERDDGGQSTFAPPNDNTHTLGSISCGHETIVVGSYDAHVAGAPLSFFSSAGPTRDNRQKPDISAPGHNVIAAASTTITGTTRMSGTSMASPMVTGTVALLLAEAAARQRDLSIADIRTALSGSARRNPPAAQGWDPRYGMGRISANAVVSSLLPQPVATVSAELSRRGQSRVIRAAAPAKTVKHVRRPKKRKAADRR
jgi:subtilisin family serine protease